MPTARNSRTTVRSKSSISPTIVALGSFLVLVIGASALLLRSEPPLIEPQVVPTPAPPSINMVDCLVAAEKIEAGAALDPSKFRKETRAIAVGTTTLITSFDKLRGAYAASFIAAGQPLLAEYMTSKAPINEIQANIPDGFRAVSIAVDDVSNVEGWVRAGAKVDVMLASQLNGKPVITMVVQNAKVLSAGQIAAAKGKGDITTITIMVTVEEAAKIQLASTAGQMSLSLRGDEETVESAESTTVSIDAVFGIPSRQGTPVPGREGTVKVGSRVFAIIDGKLVPQESLDTKN